MSTRLSPQERLRIRARSGCADETVKRYPNCTDASRRRIERAAEEEGIDLAERLGEANPAARLGARIGD